MRRAGRSSRRRAALLVLLAVATPGAVASCGDRRAPPVARRSPSGPLEVLAAGSLARPLRAALDSFAAHEGIRVALESAGSLETVRRIIDLQRTPDIVALADRELFGRLLMPAHATWYVAFARSRMVLAYSDRSRGAADLRGDRWTEVLQRPGVEVGRSDPDLDPAGYRALIAMRLAERHYARRGLADRLLAAAPARNVRPKSTDLVGLLQAGELDYIWVYESVARAAGLRTFELPSRVNLGEPADSAFYAGATVRVLGAAAGDTLEIHGEPIVFALGIPARAEHAAAAGQFIVWLLSAPGRRTLRALHVDLLDPAELTGSGVPRAIVRAVEAR